MAGLSACRDRLFNISGHRAARLITDLRLGAATHKLSQIICPAWQANQNLIHKAFLFDETSRRGGGVYLWKNISQTSARASFPRPHKVHLWCQSGVSVFRRACGDRQHCEAGHRQRSLKRKHPQSIASVSGPQLTRASRLQFRAQSEHDYLRCECPLKRPTDSPANEGLVMGCSGTATKRPTKSSTTACPLWAPGVRSRFSPTTIRPVVSKQTFGKIELHGHW